MKRCRHSHLRTGQNKSFKTSLVWPYLLIYPARIRRGIQDEISTVRIISLSWSSTYAAEGLDRRLPRLALRDGSQTRFLSCRRPHKRLGFAYQVAFVRLFDRFPQQQPFELFEELVWFSAAQLGLRKIRGLRIVEKWTCFIQPHDGYRGNTRDAAT